MFGGSNLVHQAAKRLASSLHYPLNFVIALDSIYKYITM